MVKKYLSRMSWKLSRMVLRRGKGSNPFSLVDYVSKAYQNLLKKHGITASMSRKGNCYDNACMEPFFRTLKTKLIYFYVYKSRQEAKSSIFEYVEIFYNNERLHSSLGYRSPNEYSKFAI
jgi:transposase InsO family protein